MSKKNYSAAQRLMQEWLASPVVFGFFEDEIMEDARAHLSFKSNESHL
jgi:hypothetical protein